jgi:AraC-like DNA-binding protein
MNLDEYPKVYLYRRIVQSKLFIDSHFAEAIDLANIADKAFFSKFHFIRLFKKIYGKSPYQYLAFVRLEKAKELLVKGMPVSEVVESIGFESVSSFTGLFKRTNGLTPSDYQRQQLKIKQDLFDTPLRFIPNCFAEAKSWTKNSNFGEVIG